MGMATGAPGRPRSEYDVTDVAPRPLRKWSTKTLPPRLALDIVAVYLSGSLATSASTTSRANAPTRGHCAREVNGTTTCTPLPPEVRR